MKSTWYKVHNYGKTKKFKKNALRRNANDHGEFQTQSPQRLVDSYGYKHMNSRNNR